jgi:hypothetical protein
LESYSNKEGRDQRRCGEKLVDVNIEVRILDKRYQKAGAKGIFRWEMEDLPLTIHKQQ